MVSLSLHIQLWGTCRKPYSSTTGTTLYWTRVIRSGIQMLELLLLANRYYILMDTCINISKVHAVVINKFFFFNFLFSSFALLTDSFCQAHQCRTIWRSCGLCLILCSPANWGHCLFLWSSSPCQLLWVDIVMHLLYRYTHKIVK